MKKRRNNKTSVCGVWLEWFRLALPDASGGMEINFPRKYRGEIMTIKSYKFELGQRIYSKQLSKMGTVIARMDAVTSEDIYLFEHQSKTGMRMQSWQFESAFEKTDPMRRALGSIE
jgi:hypothetical protein